MHRVLLAIFFYASGSFVMASDDAPGWLREVTTHKTPAYLPKVPAVALIREMTITIGENGRVISSVRNALKVLTREGRGQAYGSLIYLAGTGKVREARAWMLSSSGELLKIGKENVTDRPYANGNEYEDLRVRQLDGRNKADPGSVFGYELVSEDVRPFTQFEWLFQDRLPVVVSRFTLVMPSGWEAKSTVLNHAAIEPVIQGSTYTWEIRELPYVEPEPASPSFVSLVPRLVVSYFPSAGSKAPAARAFTSWRDVSRWISEISDSQSGATEAIKGKVLSLTASAQTELQRIQAIAAYVQSMRYISIQTGLSRGGGYRPRSAAETFAKEYGDCTDKSTLMRAMLKAIGINSYLVAINGIDRGYVQESWPSPEQFNHAIVAIVISPETRAASVLDHPTLGRLLLFDPTSITFVDDLPRQEQGSLALIAAGEKGDLVRMPMTPPSFNLVEREIRGVLDENGGLRASIHTVTHGQPAAADRAMYYSERHEQFLNTIQQWVTRGSAGSIASKIEPRDDVQRRVFVLDADLASPAYAQRKGSGLMIFKPAIVNRREAVFLTEPTRTTPVRFEAFTWREIVRLALPVGFKVDELPDQARLDTPFGSYAASFEVKNGELVFTRTWELRPALIPATQYGPVREFYERILTVEQSPVVLVRQ